MPAAELWYNDSEGAQIWPQKHTEPSRKETAFLCDSVATRKVMVKMSEEEKVQEKHAFATLIEVGEEVIRSLKGTLPDEFWQHRAAARREALLALRALIDAAIERLEAEPQPEAAVEVEPAPKKKPRRRKVKVE